MISYQTVEALKGPLVFIKNTEKVGYQELVSLTDPNGRKSQGQVIALDGDTAIVQLFENSAGLQIEGATAEFSGETKKIALAPTILGRIFNGTGQPLDNKPAVKGEKEADVNGNYLSQLQMENLPLEYRDVYGSAINPFRRAEPDDFIQTGISTIDLTNTVVKGQKIPIFSGSGLPDLEILTRIASQARTNDPNDKFTVVVAAMGITNDQYQYLKEEMEKSGALTRSVMFVNIASDPVVERVLTPRLALTVAEYLAYELGFLY
jgi:V/A-type H+-transporting ATPase subunit B